MPKPLVATEEIRLYSISPAAGCGILSRMVACAGLAPSSVLSLLAWVINQDGYPAGLKVMFSTDTFPILAVGPHHAGPQYGFPSHLFRKRRIGPFQTLGGCGSDFIATFQRAFRPTGIPIGLNRPTLE